MTLKPASRRPIGRQSATPPSRSKAAPTPTLPATTDTNEPDNIAALEPDITIVQAKRDLDAGMVDTDMHAKRDLDAGMVDTDMHATPGLDAAQRAKLVPGPGGKTPPLRRHSLPEQPSAFTAEGSPPPGKVATTPPTRSSKPDPPAR